MFDSKMARWRSGNVWLSQTKRYMFYVYFLRSGGNGDIYIGYSANLKQRFAAHNTGKVRSTKSGRPWILFGYEAYENMLDAKHRELYLKSHSQRDMIKDRYKESLKLVA